jgi:hypothetical protein
VHQRAWVNLKVFDEDARTVCRYKWRNNWKDWDKFHRDVVICVFHLVGKCCEIKHQTERIEVRSSKGRINGGTSVVCEFTVNFKKIITANYDKY